MDKNMKASQLDLFNAPSPPQGEDAKPEIDPKEKLILEAFSKRNMEMRSDLSQKQIFAVLRMQTFGVKYKNTFVKSIASRFLQLQVSKGRQGRKEFKEMAQNIFNESPFYGPPSIGNRFLGKE